MSNKLCIADSVNHTDAEKHSICHMQIETGIFLHMLGMLDSCQIQASYPEGDQKGRYTDNLSQEHGKQQSEAVADQRKIFTARKHCFSKDQYMSQPLLQFRVNFIIGPCN